MTTHHEPVICDLETKYNSRILCVSSSCFLSVGRYVFVAIRTITLRIVLCIRLGEAQLYCPRVIRALQIVAKNEGSSIVVEYECACPGATILSGSADCRRGARKRLQSHYRTSYAASNVKMTVDRAIRKFFHHFFHRHSVYRMVN